MTKAAKNPAELPNHGVVLDLSEGNIEPGKQYYIGVSPGENGRNIVQMVEAAEKPHMVDFFEDTSPTRRQIDAVFGKSDLNVVGFTLVSAGYGEDKSVPEILFVKDRNGRNGVIDVSDMVNSTIGPKGLLIGADLTYWSR